MPKTYDEIIERGRRQTLALAGFDDVKHPRWPRGTPAGKGGEFMQIGDLVRYVGLGTNADPKALYKIKDFGDPSGPHRTVTLQDEAGKVVSGISPSSIRPALNPRGGHLGNVGSPGGSGGTFATEEKLKKQLADTGHVQIGDVHVQHRGQDVYEVKDLSQFHSVRTIGGAEKALTAAFGSPGARKPGGGGGAVGTTSGVFSVGDKVTYTGDAAGVVATLKSISADGKKAVIEGPDGTTLNVDASKLRQAGTRKRFGLFGMEDDMDDLFAARSATGSDAPDPSLAGPIRNIVRTAHKWGGNGVIPKFDKIKRVLAEKHPEVFAHFGGNPNVAAAWIKDNWMAMHGHDPHKWRGKGKSTAQQLATSLGYDEAPDVLLDMMTDQGITHELFCDGGEAVEADGLVWKTAARTGTWKLSPLPGGEPLTIDKGLLDDVQAAFNDGAWEHVTVPLSHADRVDENTGYVRKLKVDEDPARPGQYVLRTGIEFTDPDIETKVKQGSIANCSVGVSLSGHTRTEDGKFFPRVLKHVALTNRPWLNGLTPFGDDAIAAELACFELDDIADPSVWGDLNLQEDDAGGDDDGDEIGDTGQIAWDSDADVDSIRAAIRDKLPPGSIIIGMTFDKALCRVPGDGYGGGDAYVAGYSYDDTDGVTVDPRADWQAVQQGWLAAAQDKSGLKPLSQLSKGDKFMLGGAVHTHLGPHPTMKGHVSARSEKTRKLTAVPMTQKVKPAPSSGPGDFGLAQAVLGPDVLFCGWMEDAGVKRGDLDDGDFLIPETKTLPYKVHGKVNAAGWKAAWSTVNGGHGFTPPSGTSVDSLKKKLLASKPKGVDVNASLGAVMSVRGDLETSTDRGEGNHMGENENGDMLTLSREDLEAAITARMSSLQASHEETARELRERRVSDKCRELQAAGHAPAVIERAKAFYLADTRGDTVLTLSMQEDGKEPEDVKLTVTDVVDGLLAAMPKTSLTEGGPRHLALAREPGASTDTADLSEDDVKRIADEIEKDLKNGKVVSVTGASAQ